MRWQFLGRHLEHGVEGQLSLSHSKGPPGWVPCSSLPSLSTLGPLGRNQPKPTPFLSPVFISAPVSMLSHFLPIPAHHLSFNSLSVLQAPTFYLSFPFSVSLRLLLMSAPTLFPFLLHSPHKLQQEAVATLEHALQAVLAFGIGIRDGSGSGTGDGDDREQQQQQEPARATWLGR